MEVQGKVKALLPEQKGTSSKTGNPWKSQEFVIDYFWWPNQLFPSQMVLKMFGEDRIDKWNLQVGDEVKIRYHVEAHDYQGRWFNELRCDGVEKIGASAVVVAAQPQPTVKVEEPAAPAPEPQQQKADDLPF